MLLLRLALGTSWKQGTGAAPLAKQLAELQALDGGDGVDLVVGLSPPTELLTFSFSQLGVAEVLGKHLVRRSASDADELEAIEAAFPDLDSEARRELYVKRKLHKATALLHELGHALGAIHTTQREELMYPSYSTDMESFSEPTRALLRISLESRHGATAPKNTPTLAARVLELLKRTPAGTWNRDDVEARVSALEQQLAAQSGGQVLPDVGDASGKPRTWPRTIWSQRDRRSRCARRQRLVVRVSSSERNYHLFDSANPTCVVLGARAPRNSCLIAV